MYPLVETFLSVYQIAVHWRRDLPQHPPLSEVIETLVAAIWGGDLRATLGAGERSLRDELLGWLLKSSPHPGILIDDTDVLTPAVSPTAEGGVLVDVRNRINLPCDSTAWTADVIGRAYGVLAKCKFDDYNDTFKTLITFLKIVQSDFAAFCDVRGYERPAFWFKLNNASRTKPHSFSGRPSIMAAIEQEMRRRAVARELEPTLSSEALKLEAWAKQAYPGQQGPKSGSIKNALRSVYWELCREIEKPKHET